jgi:hypothetical protein
VLTFRAPAKLIVAVEPATEREGLSPYARTSALTTGVGRMKPSRQSSAPALSFDVRQCALVGKAPVLTSLASIRYSRRSLHLR